MNCYTPELTFGITPNTTKMCVHIRTAEHCVVVVADPDETSYRAMLPRVRQAAHRLARALPLD